MILGNVVFEDTTGESERPPGRRLEQIELPEPLGDALSSHMGRGVTLTPPQEEALRQGVLWDAAHFLISAPTNSGKTLIALLRIFARALRDGGRFVYVAPLKALAEQKTRELLEIGEQIARCGGRRISVRISTGDYRVSEDFPDSPPDDTAEIFVCTPERLEVILRNPDNHPWAASVDTFVLDEFHILGQRNRGARFEMLVTQLLLCCPDSALLGLSATIGSLDSVARWLSQGNMPVRLVQSNFRAPRLRRRCLQVADKDNWIADVAGEVLADFERSLLVFVYRQNDAVRLAKRIGGQGAFPYSVAVFHSALPLHAKKEVLSAFGEGRTRVLVCTTALAMGINSPATDVVVRDTVFFGHGRLSPSDIMQMTGRAGRGQVEGSAVVLFSENESWHELAAALADDRLEALEPQLIPRHRGPKGTKAVNAPETNALRTSLLSEISTKTSVQLADLQNFVSHTYSAMCQGVAARDVLSAVEYLVAEKLVYRLDNSESEVSATKLGRTASYSGLTAESGALLGSFMRALITLSEKETGPGAARINYLRRLTAIDFLILVLAAYEVREVSLASSFKAKREAAENYIEGLDPDQKPLMHLWRDPLSQTHATRRLLSTLRLGGTGTEETYWKLMSMASALHEYACSRRSVDEITVSWGLKVDLEGRLVPLVSWLLNSLSQICSGGKCYRLDFLLPEMRSLIQDLAVGGGFGKLLALPGVGLATIDRIRASGVSSMQDLSGLSVEKLGEMGVRASAAASIARLLGRRRR